MFNLVSDRVFAHKDEEDKAASEKVETSNDPEDNLSEREALHVPVISMDKIVNTFNNPEDAHHDEQLAE